MQRILLSAAVISILLFACNTETKEEKTAETKTPEPRSVPFPYTASYSSAIEIGDPVHTQTILNLTKAWDNRSLLSVKDLFADTIQIYTADGSAMVGHKDSILAGVQGYLDQFSSIVTKPSTFFSVKSTDMNENWALIWATEVRTAKNGKVDSTNFQETWRLNKDGKANLLFQYAMAPAPPAK